MDKALRVLGTNMEALEEARTVSDADIALLSSEHDMTEFLQ
jgi:hypothetical protein